MLEAVLGVEKVVEKRREVWCKDNVIFNLDHIHHVGADFELEIEIETGDDNARQAAHYRRRFTPYLGTAIVGSNEDIILELLEAKI